MDAKTLIFEASLFDQWEHPSRRFSVKSVPEFLGPCRARPGPREILWSRNGLNSLDSVYICLSTSMPMEIDGDIDKKIVASGFPSAVAVQDRYHIHDLLWENLERCHYKRPRQTWQVRDLSTKWDFSTSEWGCNLQCNHDCVGMGLVWPHCSHYWCSWKYLKTSRNIPGTTNQSWLT